MSGERVGRSERQQNDGNDGALRVSKIVKLINLLGVNERKGERWTRINTTGAKTREQGKALALCWVGPADKGAGVWSFPLIG